MIGQHEVEVQTKVKTSQALDIRHIRGAAGDFGVGGDVADKAVVQYARGLEDKTDMGGGTFTELEKLGGSGYEEQREMLKRREAKKKSEEQKKRKMKIKIKIGNIMPLANLVSSRNNTVAVRTSPIYQNG